MTHEPKDARRERLVAALYGELEPAEQRELERELAGDPALRAEMEELEEARGWLREWKPDEAPPSFTIVAQDRARPMRRTRAAFLAWAFGGATVALSALLIAGLRVDRVDGGVAVRFGEPGGPVLSAEGPARDTLPVVKTEPAPIVSATQSPAPAPVTPVPASATAALTREDLDAYTQDMAQVMAALLQQAETHQRAEMGSAFERFYEAIRLERQRDLADLRTELHGVGLGLMAEQTRTNARLSRLLDNGAPDGVPASATPVEGTPRHQEKEQNDE
jgi:anti-sigma factor RsiW